MLYRKINMDQKSYYNSYLIRIYTSGPKMLKTILFQTIKNNFLLILQLVMNAINGIIYKKIQTNCNY